MPTPGPFELILIFGIFLLLFGAKKLPELGSSVGRSIRGFKKGLEDTNTAETTELEDGSTVTRSGK